MQPLDVLFDGINELGLVLLDGSTNLGDRLATRHESSQTLVSYLWANKKSVELGEHPEHLIGVPRCPQSIPETGDDLILHSSHALVVRVLGGDPNLGSLYRISCLITIASEGWKGTHRQTRQERRSVS